MDQITGGYIQTELRDGRMGNYHVAQQYYRDFDRLRIESPDKFNRICHSVLSENREWIEDDKQVLSICGLAYRRAVGKDAVLARPEDEIKDFIRLAIAPTIVSRIFGVLTGGHPDYDLHSPFKYPVRGYPDEVDASLRQTVVLDWEGHDERDYPGNKLVPNPDAKPKKIHRWITIHHQFFKRK